MQNEPETPPQHDPKQAGKDPKIDPGWFDEINFEKHSGLQMFFPVEPKGLDGPPDG